MLRNLVFQIFINQFQEFLVHIRPITTSHQKMTEAESASNILFFMMSDVT